MFKNCGKDGEVLLSAQSFPIRRQPVSQPYMRGRSYRVTGSLVTTDTILENTFWLGVRSAVTLEMLTYVVESFVEWDRRLAYDC